MRTIQIQTLSEAVDPPSGSWENEGEEILRYNISRYQAQNRLADMIEYIREQEAEGVWVGEDVNHNLVLSKKLDEVGAACLQLLLDGEAAGRTRQG